MRVGITFSTFDLLHAGHIAMLREAKEQCDYLIAGIQVDPTIDRPEKNKPVQTIVERYTQLKGVRYVDEIIPYVKERDIDDILNLRNGIHVRILGVEYEGKNFSGKEVGERLGIEHYYNKRNHRFSSTDLRQRVLTNNVLNKSITIAFDGAIVIDCWGGDWTNKHSPNSVNLYNRLQQFFTKRPPTHIVFATYDGHGEDRPLLPILYSINTVEHTHHITTLEEFNDKGLNHGKWLITGLDWGECIHKRRLGVIKLLKHTQIELYIKTSLLNKKNCQDVSDLDVVNDFKAEWERAGDYWKAKGHIENSFDISKLDEEYGA